MPLYEHVFLARQDISAQQVESLTDTFKAIITDNGGSIGKTEYWGLRSLAYRIKKKRKAHYSLINIDAPHAAVAEMERQMRIESDIIRFLTLRVDEHETDPSAMMKRHERDDRRGHRGGRDGRDGPSRRPPPTDRAESPKPKAADADAETESKDKPEPAKAPDAAEAKVPDAAEKSDA